MDVSINEDGSTRIAVVRSSETIISDADDALDLMATVRNTYGCDAMVIDRAAITERFFDLKTGVAGEILRKFTTYHFKVAIVGEFGDSGDRNLEAFIREGNRGNQFFFLPTEESAIERLCKLYE